MDIFENLNKLLTESESKSKVKESDIPVHPEMETKEQGNIAAAEKILKLFQKLKVGGSGEGIDDGKPEIPDDIIDPMMKEPPKSHKDKTFEKNKLAGWDENSDDKIKKEIDTDSGVEDDEFDDFDYRNNEFGDEDNDDEIPDYDDRSEDEKLKDTIDDAIDSLNNDSDSSIDGEDDDSGADWGDGEDNGQENGNDGEQEGQENNSNQGSQQHGSSDGKLNSKSEKQKRLEDLKKSLDSGKMKEFSDKIDEIKNATDVTKNDETPGGQIETPSDKDFKDDMKKAGIDDKTIDEMTKKKNINGNEDYTEEEMNELRKDVIDGLEKSCKEKGGSALASTIVKSAIKRKINNDEWKEMLKVFLKAKSIGSGNMSSSNKGIKFGHKNHLWRDAILPTDNAPSKGTIQNIYCFVDFSGSVNQDLVFTFLGKVIDMCMELKYTNVKVYGFGEHIVEPKTIDKKTFREALNSIKVESGESEEDAAKRVVLAQTWDYISSQYPGAGTENFADVAEEINNIKRKEKRAVFLIFGDGYW